MRFSLCGVIRLSCFRSDGSLVQVDWPTNGPYPSDEEQREQELSNADHDCTAGAVADAGGDQCADAGEDDIEDEDDEGLGLRVGGGRGREAGLGDGVRLGVRWAELSCCWMSERCTWGKVTGWKWEREGIKEGNLPCRCRWEAMPHTCWSGKVEGSEGFK